MTTAVQIRPFEAGACLLRWRSGATAPAIGCSPMERGEQQFLAMGGPKINLLVRTPTCG